MAVVLVIGSDAAAHTGAIQAAGHTVRSGKAGLALLKDMDAKPPAVVVIDLSRAPSTGRDIALAIRKRKATRHLPFVFLEEPSEGVRKLLPGETYGSWRDVAALIQKALQAGASAAVPGVMAGYAGTPLAKKLGIEAGMTVAILGEPEAFRDKMPDDVNWRERPDRRSAVALWFVRSSLELDREIEWIAGSGVKRLWIAWPKKSGRAAGDLTPDRVRLATRAAGLAESKICSIDATWSALQFTKIT